MYSLKLKIFMKQIMKTPIIDITRDLVNGNYPFLIHFKVLIILKM